MKLKKNIAISESGFVFDPSTGDSYSLNVVGVDIISHLQKQMNEETIIRELLKKYEADKIVIEKNFHDFVDMLKQYNLLEHE